jgi:hypothetical protein
MMITSEEYQRALRHAAEQTGPVVADIICRWCGGRRIGTVSRRPRGLYLVSMVDELEILSIELILRAHAQGKSWKHLVPSEWTEEQVESVITLVTGQPDYKPRTERVPPAHQRWHALLDLYPDDLPANRYQVTVGCPVHGRITFDSRQLRDAIRHARKRIRFVVPLST